MSVRDYAAARAHGRPRALLAARAGARRPFATSATCGVNLAHRRPTRGGPTRREPASASSRPPRRQVSPSAGDEPLLRAHASPRTPRGAVHRTAHRLRRGRAHPGRRASGAPRQAARPDHVAAPPRRRATWTRAHEPERVLDEAAPAGLPARQKIAISEELLGPRPPERRPVITHNLGNLEARVAPPPRRRARAAYPAGAGRSGSCWRSRRGRSSRSRSTPSARGALCRCSSSTTSARRRFERTLAHPRAAARPRSPAGGQPSSSPSSATCAPRRAGIERGAVRTPAAPWTIRPPGVRRANHIGRMRPFARTHIWTLSRGPSCSRARCARRLATIDDALRRAEPVLRGRTTR
jgi:hypothetical protein